MLQNFKSIFPWILVVILLGILLWPRERKTEESIIETQLQVEESLVDSFSSTRDSIIVLRDSSLSRIDTLEVSELMDILRRNMNWYENKTFPSWSLSGDSVGILSNDTSRLNGMLYRRGAQNNNKND